MHGENEFFRVIKHNTWLVGIIVQGRTVILYIASICSESLEHLRGRTTLGFELFAQAEQKRIPNSSSCRVPVKWCVGSVFSR